MAITANKLLGKKEKGGALVVRPTTSLTSYKGLESPDTKKPESDNLGKTLFTIQKKIILVDDLLKGTFAEKKKRQKDEVKKKEDEARIEEESKLEDKDTDDEEEGLKVKMPRLSFLDGIKKFIGDVLMGWLTFRLIKFLPQVMKAAKFLGRIADFLINVGGALFNGLVTFIDWGYKAVEWTRGAVENVFGEEGAKTFDKITGILNKVLNLQLALTLAMIAFSVEFSGGLMNWGKNFMSIFKYGLKRAGSRLLIKMLGKKAAATLLGKGAVTAATTATTATATTATTATAATTSTAATVGGVSTGVAAGAVAAAGAIAVGLGEGIFALGKKGYNIEEDWKQKAAKKRFFNPMKYWWGISAGIMGFINRIFSGIGGIFDIVGAPFRMIAELIRFPFLSKEGKEKQRTNLEKYDTRIREQFRKSLNMFDFLGVIGDDKGSWGSLYGDAAGEKASKEMGFNDKEKNDKKDKKNKTISDSIKYSVKEGKVDPDSLEEGVSLKKAQQHYLESQIKILEFKVRSSKRRYGKDANTSAMEKKLNNLKSRFNATLDYGGYDIKGNVENIIPLDVNSVANKVNNISSYDEEEETVVIKPGSETGGDVVPETETKESITPVSVGGGGGDSEVSDALYKSG